MLLMAVEQDDRIIWVVVEQHRPKGRIRSRIVLHLGQYRGGGAHLGCAAGVVAHQAAPETTARDDLCRNCQPTNHSVWCQGQGVQARVVNAGAGNQMLMNGK